MTITQLPENHSSGLGFFSRLDPKVTYRAGVVLTWPLTLGLEDGLALHSDVFRARRVGLVAAAAAATVGDLIRGMISRPPAVAVVVLASDFSGLKNLSNFFKSWRTTWLENGRFCYDIVVGNFNNCNRNS